MQCSDFLGCWTSPHPFQEYPGISLGKKGVPLQNPRQVCLHLHHLSLQGMSQGRAVLLSSASLNPALKTETRPEPNVTEVQRVWFARSPPPPGSLQRLQ